MINDKSLKAVCVFDSKRLVGMLFMDKFEGLTLFSRKDLRKLFALRGNIKPKFRTKWEKKKIQRREK